MLRHLFIKNYALIESLDIDFHRGFSVITGETGAGKSIILGALSLLLGERADTKAIKPGTSKCIIEASYDTSVLDLKSFFEENELEYDASECIIRRELYDTGKTRAFINDTPVAVSVLKALGVHLLDIHSQHQNLLLNNRDFQFKVLDTVAGNKDISDAYSVVYKEYQETAKKLADFENSLQSQKSNNEFRIFQLRQIDEANLKPAEQEELEEESKILNNTGEIKEALFKVEQLMSEEENGILERLSNCSSLLNSLSDIFPRVSSLSERLNSCSIELDDIQKDISHFLYQVNFDPERQIYVNERLDSIIALENKYHKGSIQELLDYAEVLRNEIGMFIDSDETLKKMSEEKKALYEKAYSLAQSLSASRKEAIKKVENNIKEHLALLGMPNIRFEVQHERQEQLSKNGIDVIRFLFSANKDMPLQDMASIASGGEIARFMLSLKAILSSGVPKQTLIFDEIDTGVSGRIAEKMALTMKSISDNGHQVISITHLPQIAAKGDFHYLVYKEDSKKATLTHIKQLQQEERIQEIAHMLSGSNITESAVSNARDLLNL